MHKLFAASLLAVAFSSPVAIAQQAADEHAAHRAPAPAPEDGSGGKAADPMRQLGDNMKKIQDLMAQIHAATEEDAREALMAQHLKAMREEIAALVALAPPKMGMMGDKGVKDGGGAGKPATGASKDAADPHAGMDMSDSKDGKDAKGGGMGMMMEKGMGMMKMHKQMEARVRMLELLLQQMLEREAVEAGGEHDHH